MNSDLTQIDGLCREIDAARDVHTAKTIRDKAIALVRFFKQQMDEEAKERMEVVRLRAERRIGELTGKMEKAPADHKSQKIKSARGGFDPKKKALAEAGISSQEASEYERLAKVPGDQFEAILADPRGPRTARAVVAYATENLSKAKAADKEWGEFKEVLADLADPEGREVRDTSAENERRAKIIATAFDNDKERAALAMLANDTFLADLSYGSDATPEELKIAA